MDDFALRRGTSYGTILLDLRRGKPLELLPSRDTASVAAWLKRRPQVEVVARDRSKEYALAVTRGAPQTTQVIDRWHVLKNLREAVERDLDRRYAGIKARLEVSGLAGKGVPRSPGERNATGACIPSTGRA